MNQTVPPTERTIRRAARRAEQARLLKLGRAMQRRAPLDAVKVLGKEDDATIAKVLSGLDPVFAFQLFNRLPEDRRNAVLPAMPADLGEQWHRNQQWPEDSIGRLMESPTAVFITGTTVREAVKTIRHLARTRMFTYAYVVDSEERLQGVVVMRDLLLAKREQLLDDIMITEPFSFLPDAELDEALRQVMHRHYPVYPVCDADGKLIGLVHGYVLFEMNAVEISAQPGLMVGVANEEHISSSLFTSLKLRHPWLQLNVFTAFMAAAVVGVFEGTIAQVVALAVFLPVLAGQSGNTGCQALAVTLRGLTLRELKSGMTTAILRKEALLGFSNGVLVGITAATGMLLYALGTGAPAPWLLALVVLLAMTGACVISGLTGVLVPLTLQRWGADPATASSIFVTTFTDVASMGLLLGLATLIIL